MDEGSGKRRRGVGVSVKFGLGASSTLAISGFGQWWFLFAD